VGIAALEEGVISPQREIFSPGYLEIPNPYNPDKPTRYADWRYQGNVNLYSALAQSSNVYFYTVGGGAGDIKGLGITKLRNWWQEFNFGVPTGIDLPGEAKGFLPSPEWKEKTQKRSWLLGDTYNVSIGQGDFLVTPIQLLSYIGAVANGGKIYRPYIVQELNQPKINKDLTGILSQIKEAQKGMRMGVTSPMGTSYRLNDLPFEVAAKTGSAQVKNNTQENAFFVGYAPYQNPKIAILVLIENSKEGSLNAVPIAKDVLSWYYENRLK
jgi:penicillin-binding protein 2